MYKLCYWWLKTKQANVAFKKRVDLKGQNSFNTPHAQMVTKINRFGDVFAQIAQSVEQRIENPRVGGSIPPLGTTYFRCCRLSSVGRATDL